MSNPSTVSLQLVAAVANGICQSQQPAGAGALTLNGSLVSSGVATMDVARRIVIASNGNDAAVVFTVTGTNQDGNPISSTVTGLNASGAYTALDFATVTSVTSSAATVGQITVGTNGVASTKWILDNYLSPYWALAVAVQVSVAAVNYTVEHTYDDPNAGQSLPLSGFSLAQGSNVPPVPWPHPVLSAASASLEGQYPDKPVFAHRLTINSGTGKAAMQSIQAGIGSP